MESVLIVVTVVSLGLAVTMSVVAWTLLRNERERSAARADALQALAFDHEDVDGSETALELTGRDDLEVVPREHHDPARAVLSTTSDVPAWDATLRRDQPVGDMFDTDRPEPATGRRGLAVLAVGLIFLIGYFAASTFRSPEVVASIAASKPGPASRPLELLSLKHMTDEDGSFVVTGFVQNPTDGTDLVQVDAVVYLFDHEDEYFAMGRAPLDAPTIHAGGESPFVVRIPGVSRVARYRVGFRRPDGVVAHVDRRGHLPEGTTGDTLPQSELVSPAGGLR